MESRRERVYEMRQDLERIDGEILRLEETKTVMLTSENVNIPGSA